MAEIKSSRYKNLFFTYLYSKANLSKGAIILLDGLPSNPSSKTNLINFLSEKGFDVFFPRYEGTWESEGIFLLRAPSEAVIEFIKKLKEGIKIKKTFYKNKNILILGASFGGGVALDISTKENVGKICVLSPVISFRKVEGIENLESYLNKEYREDYRFNLKGWKKLLKDELWNLNETKIYGSNKIWVGIGKSDGQVKERDIKKFCERKDISVETYDLGHITLSKIPFSMLEEIINFFKN
jgi:esterase/lipase